MRRGNSPGRGRWPRPAELPHTAARRFEKAGLQIIATKMMHLTKEQAGEFYAVHKERPFYGELIDYMTSGPIMVQVLEGEGAIAKNREVMGATNPAEAAAGW